MSEFSDALLVHTKHTTAVLEAVKIYPYRYEGRQLNERWFAVFLEYPNFDYTSAREWMLQISSQFPLMFFDKTSDHGWAYQIYAAGHIIAELEVSYELTWNMWVDLMEVRHPEMEMPYDDIGQDETEQMYAEIEASEQFRAQATEQYRKASPDSFRLFDFTGEQIQTIRTVLDVEWYIDKTRRYEQVNAFIKSVEIAPFDWLSFRYLSS